MDIITRKSSFNQSGGSNKNKKLKIIEYTLGYMVYNRPDVA